MADRDESKARRTPESNASDADAADAERRLGRLLARATPAATIALAGAAGAAFGLGPTVLVVAGGLLLGAVALFWASLRTLTGDAPLPEDMQSLAVRRSPASQLEERKLQVLRALKDLDNERKYGKIDEADYAEVSKKYRDEAKEILREQDLEIEPFRAKAETMAKEYLKRKGLGDEPSGKKGKKKGEEPRKPKDEALDEDETSSSKVPAASDSTPDVAPPSDEDVADELEQEEEPAPAKKSTARQACAKCKVSNEPDATFCKKCGAKLTAPRDEDSADTDANEEEED